MQLVVPMAVSAAVSAAITMRSAISMNFVFSFIVVVLRELEEFRGSQRTLLKQAIRPLNSKAEGR